MKEIIDLLKSLAEASKFKDKEKIHAAVVILSKFLEDHEKMKKDLIGYKQYYEFSNGTHSNGFAVLAQKSTTSEEKTK